MIKSLCDTLVLKNNIMLSIFSIFWEPFFPVLSFSRTEIFYNLVIIRLIQVEILTLLQRLIAGVSLTKVVSIYR